MITLQDLQSKSTKKQRFRGEKKMNRRVPQGERGLVRWKYHQQEQDERQGRRVGVFRRGAPSE